MKLHLQSLARTLFLPIFLAALVQPTKGAPPPLEALSSAVNTESWTIVQLSESYSEPVVVCTPVYAPTAPPSAVRMRNVRPSSFEIRLERLDRSSAPHRAKAHCIATQQGVYSVDRHGVKMEAQTLTLRRPNRARELRGQKRLLRNRYNSPVVLGQVMTARSRRFSMFWGKPSTPLQHDAGTFIEVGSHIGEDPRADREAESIGYIVIESGSGQFGALSYEAGVGSPTAPGPQVTTYRLGTLSGASAAILGNSSMTGQDGGFAVLAGLNTSGAESLSLFVDEDQLRDQERKHCPEQVAYLAIGAATAPPPPPSPTPSPVNPQISLQVSPLSAQLRPGQSLLFSATSTGGDPGRLQWSLSASVGSLAVSGNSAVYVAPATFGRSDTVEIKAFSLMEPNKIFATALVSLLPAITTSITPNSVELQAGQSVQFSATVANTSDQRVQWSTDRPVGAITQTGLYTAPPSEPLGRNLVVTAQANANPRTPARASVAIRPDENVLSFATYEHGLKTLIFEGVDYNYPYPGEPLLTKLYYTGPAGEKFEGTPSCQKTETDNVVRHICQLNGTPSTLTAAYSLCRNDTLCIDIEFSNDDPALTVTLALLSPIGFSMDTFRPEASFGLSALGPGNPLTVGDFGSGKWALWFDGRREEVYLKTHCGWQYVCKTQPRIEQVGPSGKSTFRLHVRFTDDVVISRDRLAPEAYESYRESYPPVINWPDRRPIVSWFIADVGKRTNVNPRGYLQNPDLDVSDLARFREAVLGRARQVRDSLAARAVRPQGIILWDIEGQEFIHPTTYIGDPRVFQSGYAAEMNYVADELFSVFREGGYRLGITIRPQYVQWGTDLPSTCNSDPNHDFKDYFVKVNNPYRQRFHACYDPTGQAWAVIPDSNGGQTAFRVGQEDEIYRLLRAKASYARKRWGATIFYLDSAVYSGGKPIDANILRSLQADFPDCLFIPEQEYLDTMTAGVAYSDPRVSGDPRFSPLTWRWVYPEAAFAVKLSDCSGTCWDRNRSAFLIGQKIGDIAILNAPYQSDPKHLAAIEEMILQARTESSSVVVHDISSQRRQTFYGSPASVSDYPLKMRVYFAPSAHEVSSSTTYCESGQQLGENECELDLSGKPVSQIRYYDFAGKLFYSGPPVTSK